MTSAEDQCVRSIALKVGMLPSMPSPEEMPLHALDNRDVCEGCNDWQTQFELLELAYVEDSAGHWWVRNMIPHVPWSTRYQGRTLCKYAAMLTGDKHFDHVRRSFVLPTVGQRHEIGSICAATSSGDVSNIGALLLDGDRLDFVEEDVKQQPPGPRRMEALHHHIEVGWQSLHQYGGSHGYGSERKSQCAHHSTDG